MSKAEAPTTSLQCQTLPVLHLVDRRDFLKDSLGNYVLDPRTGEPLVTARCVCGKTNAHSSEFRGQDYVLIYSDADIPKHAAAKHGK